MKFDKLYKSIAAILTAAFILFDVAQGQTIVNAQKVSKTKKTLDTGCNLTDYELKHIFTKVDILASFKNSSEKWFEYAQNNFDFNTVLKQLPDTLQHFQDSIFVRFIVTKSGQVCKIEILKGNQILADPVIKLLKISAQWQPGSSEGRNLNTYRTLKIEVSFDRLKNESKIIHNFTSYFNRDG